MKYIAVFLFAVIALIVLAPSLFLFGIIAYTFSGGLGDYLYRVAYSIDQLGNAIGGPFWQVLLVNKAAPYKFGDPDDTISYALARNVGYYTIFGLILEWALETIDPGHMAKALKS